ncbi:MAG: metalloregulator ArsR/SmtB family transcription factor [Planctomycetaceae bacterium]|nr:metalloregulator ArsR/SmtB family transcription factor [Planctomycetaceae bacterium]
MTRDEQRLLQMKADIFQAVGHPIRLAIVELLKDGEMCVCDIATRVGAERSNVSRHLAILLSAGVLSVRKDGLKMIYELTTPCVLNFLSCVTDIVRRKVRSDAKVLANL